MLFKKSMRVIDFKVCNVLFLSRNETRNIFLINYKADNLKLKKCSINRQKKEKKTIWHIYQKKERQLLDMMS